MQGGIYIPLPDSRQHLNPRGKAWHMLIPRPFHSWFNLSGASWKSVFSAKLLGHAGVGVWGQSEKHQWVHQQLDSDWSLNLAPPTMSCVTLDKSPHPSEPSFAYLESEAITVVLTSLQCCEHVLAWRERAASDTGPSDGHLLVLTPLCPPARDCGLAPATCF